MRGGLPQRGRIGDGAGVMRAAAIAAVLLLAACSQKPQPPENQSTANEKVTQANVGGNMAGVSVAEANGTSNQAAAANTSNGLPPATAALRFVGRWAKSDAECKTKPWVFTDKELSAVGGPHCTIYNIAKAPGGYNLAATCPAKVPVHTDLISIRFAESAQAMLVESNAISPMGLVYCGK
jgi:hypothetical protein